MNDQRGAAAERVVSPDAARVLAESDLRDRELRLRLAAWREGYAAAAAQFREHYERGLTDGVLAYKAAEHGVVRDLRQHLRAWGGLREHFADPRPGDYMGRGAA